MLLSDSMNAASITTRQRLVWCHYTAWHDWNKASSAAKRYYDLPLAHPVGDHQKDYRLEVDAALRMGIDGFLVDLVRGEIFSDHTVKMLEAARGTPFMVSVCLDGFGDPAPRLAEKTAKLFRRIGDHPNLPRVDGKPVVATFWAFRASPEYWRDFRAELANRGVRLFLVGDPDSHWSRPATPTEHERYAGCFDMIYSFGELGRGGKQPLAETFEVLAGSAKTTTSSGKWMGGVKPGYLGAWLNGRNDFYNPFNGFDQYWLSWEHAVANDTAWMHLTTWNDLDETPLQPMVFQFHAYSELTRYWKDRWRGTYQPTESPRIYLAYQREQVLGTVQRIELVSLPTVEKTITAVLEIRDMSGKQRLSLPALTFSGSETVRRDWAVPTAAFADTPVLEPVLHITAGQTELTRRLPFIVLRTGWIANQVVVKVPVHEMSDGQAALTVTRDESGHLQASVTLNAPSAEVAHVTLWRNDRSFAAFTKDVPRGVGYQLAFSHIRDVNLTIDITGGEFVRAYGTNFTKAPTLTWDATSLATRFEKYQHLAAELLDTGNATLSVTVDDAAPQIVRLADLREDSVEVVAGDRKAVCRLALSEVDLISANPPQLGMSHGTLPGRWYTDSAYAQDLFYARCETSDGRVFYSNAVTPFSNQLPAVPTTILQTAEFLDGGVKSFLVPPPFTTPEPLAVSAHPAMVQQMEWNVDHGDGSRDSRGRNHLYLGGAGQRYGRDAKRVPTRVARQDVPGHCLSFDGIDDIVQIPIRQMPVGAFTVSLDICPGGDGGKAQTVLGRSGWQGCPVLALLADGRLQGGRGLQKPHESLLVESKVPLPKGAWSHIDMNFDERTVRLFVNGVPVGSVSGKPVRVYGNARIYLGGDPGHPFCGKIDNVVIRSVSQGVPE